MLTKVDINVDICASVAVIYNFPLGRLLLLRLLCYCLLNFFRSAYVRATIGVFERRAHCSPDLGDIYPAAVPVNLRDGY